MSWHSDVLHVPELGLVIPWEHCEKEIGKLNMTRAQIHRYCLKIVLRSSVNLGPGLWKWNRRTKIHVVWRGIVGSLCSPQISGKEDSVSLHSVLWYIHVNSYIALYTLFTNCHNSSLLCYNSYTWSCDMSVIFVNENGNKNKNCLRTERERIFVSGNRMWKPTVKIVCRMRI